MPIGFNDLSGICISKGSEDEDAPSGCIRAPANLRPFGFKRIIVQKLFRHLPLITNSLQRGFIPSRNFGNNIIELDAASPIYSTPQNASVAMPYLLSFDFQQAFPSAAHEWIHFVLRQMQLPSFIRWFFAELHRCVQCFSATMARHTLLCFVQSGNVQGCPGSGFLFAICADPSMQDFDRSVNLRNCGIIKACADDIGAAVARIE
eukprot:6296149-Pyramimonas_sp.AAC.1